MPKEFIAPTSESSTKKPKIQKTKKPKIDPQVVSSRAVQRVLQNPNPSTLTPHMITSLQQSHGNQFVIQLIRTMRDPSQQTIQREDEEGIVGNTASLGDIGGALVSIYEAYNGEDSANAILKAVTELSGNLADTTGGMKDTKEGTTSNTLKPTSAQGIGAWSRIAGGVTSVVTKGSELVGTLGGYGKSAMDYAGSFGYGTKYTSKIGDASAWIGGWAGSAAEFVSPYAYYTELAASASKAVTGVTDGWSAGYIMADLAKLVKSGTTADTKKAAEMMFNTAWWKRLEGYGGGAVGAIEGGSAIWFGPVSKGITAVLTKSYESGWGSYLLRAIGSSITSSVYSNAQVQQQAEDEKNQLMGLVPSLVANGKVKDLVMLSKSAEALGLEDFSKAILEEFDKAPSGKEHRYENRKEAFLSQMKG